MELWIVFTLLAVLMQSLRTAAQKQLSGEMSALATTLARYLYGLPLVVVYLIAVAAYSKSGIPALERSLSGLCQWCRDSTDSGNRLYDSVISTQKLCRGSDICQDRGIICRCGWCFVFFTAVNCYWLGRGCCGGTGGLVDEYGAGQAACGMEGCCSWLGVWIWFCNYISVVTGSQPLPTGGVFIRSRINSVLHGAVTNGHSDCLSVVEGARGRFKHYGNTVELAGLSERPARWVQLAGLPR